jgi:signal peptidase I
VRNSITQTLKDQFASKEGKNDYKGMARSFLIALLLAMLFRSFLFEPFHIPSGSMKPTLLIGDYIFVSKYSYGISRYSFPFGPDLFDGRIGQFHQPERGDVVVFKLPRDPKTNYIKRLIGLPGDKLQVKEGLLYVNGTPVKLIPNGNFIDKDESQPFSKILERFTEVLPNSVSHAVLNEVQDGVLDDTEEYIVPEKHYFFMGDNRDNSQDSRVLSSVGYVPEVNLVGRAEVIVFSSRAELLKPWTWFTSLRPEHKQP